MFMIKKSAMNVITNYPDATVFEDGYSAVHVRKSVHLRAAVGGEMCRQSHAHRTGLSTGILPTTDQGALSTRLWDVSVQ